MLASIWLHAITPAGGDGSLLPTAGSVRAVGLREAIERPDGPRVTPGLLLRGLAWALVIGLAGGLLPAIRAARMPVTQALRTL